MAMLPAHPHFQPQDFPYSFEEGMQHWLLWSNLELPQERYVQLIAERFPDEQWETAHWVNPPVLQSVMEVRGSTWATCMKLWGYHCGRGRVHVHVRVFVCACVCLLACTHMRACVHVRAHMFRCPGCACIAHVPRH